MTMRHWCALAVVTVLVAAGGCTATPDYSRQSSWLEQPESIDQPVDVFFVYPTIYDGESPSNMEIADADLQKRAMGTVVADGSVFTDSANLFAPLYRQMSFAYLSPDEDVYTNPYFLTGADDVVRAFDYYLEHLSDGRPFILAGHSQGSMALTYLMRKRFNDPALQKRLVAAYLIGYSITPDDLKTYPWFRPATGAADTGVIISWNTQSPTATGSPVLQPGAICINPLTWSTRSAPADKSLNGGAVFYDTAAQTVSRVVPEYTGARIDPATGALTTTPPDADNLDIGSFPEGVFHKFDYAFWYTNIKRNVAVRVAKMLSK